MYVRMRQRVTQRENGYADLRQVSENLRAIAYFDRADARDELLLIAESIESVADMFEISRAQKPDDAILAHELRMALGLPTKKTARLLYFLMQHPSEWHSRDQLIYKLKTTRQSLFAMLSYIRKALEPHGIRGSLVTFDAGYIMSVEAAHMLRKLVEQSQQTGHSALHRARCADERARLPLAASGGVPNAAPIFLAATGLEPRASTQLKILTILVNNRGRPVSALRLAREVGCTQGSLRVIMCRLRKKLAELGFSDTIRNDRIRGYRLIDSACNPRTRLGAFLAALCPVPADANSFPDDHDTREEDEVPALPTLARDAGFSLGHAAALLP